MLVPQLLLETMEELTEKEFLKFKWYLALNVLNNLKQLAKCYLETPHRHDIVSRMIESYGEEMAVNITTEILRRMKHNNAAEELNKRYTEGAAAEEKVPCPLVPSSTVLGPPAVQKFSAGGASSSIAPEVITTINGSLIINGDVSGSIIINTAYHKDDYLQN